MKRASQPNGPNRSSRIHALTLPLPPTRTRGHTHTLSLTLSHTVSRSLSRLLAPPSSRARLSFPPGKVSDLTHTLLFPPTTSIHFVFFRLLFLLPSILACLQHRGRSSIPPITRPSTPFIVIFTIVRRLEQPLVSSLRYNRAPLPLSRSSCPVLTRILLHCAAPSTWPSSCPAAPSLLPLGPAAAPA